MASLPTRASKFAALAVAIAAAAALAPASAAAQNYPDRTVRIITPFSAGGAADTLLRVIATGLNKQWPQNVIAENRTGGNTMVGAAAVAKSAPDGYTLLLTGDQTITINPHLSKSQPYDVQKDFEPVLLLALNPQILVVRPDVPAKNLQEFIALARSKPKEITFGSSGAGSVQRLAMEQLAQATGIELIHVPFRGAAETVSGLLSGTVHATFNGVSNFVQLLPTGKVRALAAAASTRPKQLPDLPTAREAGGPELKDYETLSWFGLFAPAGTPKAVIEKVQADTAKVLRAPEVEKALSARGFELVLLGPDEFRKMIAQDMAKWGGVIQRGKITLD